MLHHPEGLSGLILSGPAVKVSDAVSPVTIEISKILSRIFPKAGIIKLESAKISRDPDVVAAQEKDPLVHHQKISARLGAEMLVAMENLQTDAGRIILPLLILQGGADEMVDPSGAQLLLDLVGSTDRTLKIYDGMYHEVFNELEHDRVLDDLQRWLEAHQ